MTPANIPPKGSEMRRKADGLIGEIYSVDSGRNIVTVRWKAGSKYQTLVCTSEQLYYYWDVVRLGPRRGLLTTTFLIFAGFIVLLVWAGNSGSGNNSRSSSNPQNASTDAANPQQPKETTPPPSAAQLSSAQYLDDKYGIGGVSHCDVEADDYLRSIAKYDYAWDKTGFLETKFDHILTHVKLTFVSQKAKLQNGFGAFQHITLYCDYDTQSEKVLGFDVLQ